MQITNRMLQVVSRKSAPSAWTPSDISTDAWYDASDTDTLTLSGSEVSQWDDKSGNSRHATQSTQSLRFLTGSTINSLNALDQGNEDVMEVATFGSGDYDIFMVAKDDGTNGSISLFGSSDANTYIPLAATGDSGTNILRVNGTNDPVGAEQLYDGETTQSVSSRGDCYTAMSGLTFLVRLVDIPVITGTIKVGHAVSSYGFDGKMAEIVIVSSPSTENAQKIEGYMAHKWGIAASLPSGHPYKLSAP